MSNLSRSQFHETFASRIGGEDFDFDSLDGDEFDMPTNVAYRSRQIGNPTDPHEVERLMVSLQEQGQREPIEISRAGVPHVVDGHHRVEAAYELGMPTVRARWQSRR